MKLLFILSQLKLICSLFFVIVTHWFSCKILFSVTTSHLCSIKSDEESNQTWTETTSFITALAPTP